LSLSPMDNGTEPPPSPDSSLNGFEKMMKDAGEQHRYWITVAKGQVLFSLCNSIILTSI
jgi:hypothetical protein